MKTKLLLVFLLLLAGPSGVAAQDEINVPEVDRLRLAEAFRIGESLGHRVWMRR